MEELHVFWGGQLPCLIGFGEVVEAQGSRELPCGEGNWFCGSESDGASFAIEKMERVVAETPIQFCFQRDKECSGVCFDLNRVGTVLFPATGLDLDIALCELQCLERLEESIVLGGV